MNEEINIEDIYYSNYDIHFHDASYINNLISQCLKNGVIKCSTDYFIDDI